MNHEARLDRVFPALTHSTRRAILRQLEQHGTASVSERAAPSSLALPAVMKHLDVLERVAPITRSKSGGTMFADLAPAPMAAAMAWLGRYEGFCNDSLDRVAAHATRQEQRARKARP